uniref:Carboxylesterase type B domain-containing protein n=1 Tax=Callorhinchus milii TaxID=7868 RepID=A0A4W3JYL0_CALMI
NSRRLKMTDFYSCFVLEGYAVKCSHCVFVHIHRYISVQITVSDAILWQYRDWMDLNYSSFHIQRQTLDAVGDVGFVAPLVMTGDFITKASKVYVYYFTRRPNASVFPEWIGAGNGDELAFVFGIPIFGGPLIGEEEHVLNQQIMSYWTNFAKTGNPNSPMKVPVTWPKYNKRTSQYLQLDINLSKLNIKRQLKTEEVAFWNQHIPRLLKADPQYSRALLMTAQPAWLIGRTWKGRPVTGTRESSHSAPVNPESSQSHNG